MTIKEILQGKPYYIEKETESNPLYIPGTKKGLFKKTKPQELSRDCISYKICLTNSASPVFLTCTARQNFYEIFIYSIIIGTQKRSVDPQVAKAFFDEVEQMYITQETTKKEAELAQKKQFVYELLQQELQGKGL